MLNDMDFDNSYDTNPFDTETHEVESNDTEPQSPRRGRRPVSRGKLARVAELAVRFAGADGDALAQLAKLVGSTRTDAASLAVACAEGEDPSALVAKIVDLHAQSPVDLTVSCIVLAAERNDIKPLWDAVGTVVPLAPRVPRDPTTAGAALAKAIAGLSDAQVAGLSAPLALLG